MDIRKKLLSIVGVLALTMSMTAGITTAQEETEATNEQGLTVLYTCGSENSTPSSLALNSGSSDPVMFGIFDPSAPTTVSTAADAFRVDLNIGQCATTNWTVTASVSDFTTDPETGPVLTIPGKGFQLPFDTDSSWMVNEATPLTTVTSPTGLITFGPEGPDYSSSAPLATATTRVSGPMYLEFGADMVGLDQLDNVEDGEYSATFTVTWGVNP